MRRRRFNEAALAATLSWLLPVAPVAAHAPKASARLPVIGPMPDFALTSHRGRSFAARDLAGQVGVLTFIFTHCKDACPALTAKLVDIQKRLAGQGGKSVMFMAVSVDPARDTPEVLARYAGTLGATAPAWHFLTGSSAAVDATARGFAALARRQDNGEVDHSFLTSLIDRQGMIRVQYLGVRFSPGEFIADVRALLKEAPAR